MNGVKSKWYWGKSIAPYEVIGLQAGGTMPPVKTTGYGKAAPAIMPSTRKRTSRKGPSPNVVPLGKRPMKSFGALKYYVRF